MAVTYTQDDVLAVIEKEIGKSSLRQVARDKGLHPAQLSEVRTRKVGISDRFARAFGFQRFKSVVVTFRKAS